MPVITLLTDFGTSDEYIGVMKGVILSINPAVTIVDITHRIDPQDLVQAAYTINACYRYFPPGTIHVSVIDPGVGTGREIIALKMAGFCFLAPDNGILSLLLNNISVDEAISVNNPDYFLNSVSRTFHGRDIFAPVAGHLSRGVMLNQLGSPIDINTVKRLDLPRIKRLSDNVISGTIISVDHFGNLITNIDADTIYSICSGKPEKIPVVEMAGIDIEGLSDNYTTVPVQQPLMIIGSRNLLEISVNQGNAGRLFGKQKGDTIRMNVKEQKI
jgi:S-adenosyl-L-methionine hydrolase (adenosine-forming)